MVSKKIGSKEDKILIPEGNNLIIREDGWFQLIDKKFKEEVIDLSDGKLHRECYFCGYDEILHKHHIIRKIDGGGDDKENIIILCPNHHGLIHKSKYHLVYSKGFYLMRSTDRSKILYPTKLQLLKKRKLPSKYMKDNSRLIVKKNGGKVGFFIKNAKKS